MTRMEPAGEGGPESEFTGAFRTHAAYVRAFRILATGEEWWTPMEARLAGLGRLAAEQLAATRTRVDQAMPNGLTGCLERAWGTEVLLGTTLGLVHDSELVRLANSWASVQAYYAMYGAVQAVLVAEGKERPTQHEATQRQYVDLWTSRRSDLAPWTLAVASPERRETDARGVIGGGGRALDPGVHAWANTGTDGCWDLAAKALRSTREDRVTDALTRARTAKAKGRKDAWKREEAERLAAGKRARKAPPTRRPQLTAEEKAAAERSVRPFTVMDYLYRLRVKANYKDAAMYSEGPVEDGEARAFMRDLIELTSATMLVHELRLARVVGRHSFLQLADGWLARHGGGADRLGLLGRRDLLGRLL